MTRAAARTFSRRRHDEGLRYVIHVLWLTGFSARAIAAQLKMRTKQVAGIIDGSDLYRNRAAMTEQERAGCLQDLEQIRMSDDGAKLDRGLLDRCSFKPLPLTGRQTMRGRRG
ncbi:hypothetical protein BO068_004765 [Escherichia coli]|nr:hypothetical protein [Salmonella enterica subsp. enterica serovar Virchow]EBX4816740.1 hypothetical protein [Salmonella enterica subsp. enterica serovar Newport]ECI7685833.1 hypothetical protein [Salmonella enterica subsp. enterica serovar Paratyphi A]EFG2885582.1 hypothetical protein [Escherichia coli]